MPPVPSTSPTGTPICAKLPSRPRLFWSPHSIASSTEPLHSPPIAMPWTTPQQHQEQRRGDTDRRRPGQHADDAGRDAHHQQRDDQRGLAADPVTPVPEDRGADRAGGEPDRVGRERLHRARVRARCGEEQVREDQRRRGVVEEEVVPLDGRADRARQRRTPYLYPLCSRLKLRRADSIAFASHRARLL